MLQAPAADKKIPPKALTRQLDGLFDSLVRLFSSHTTDIQRIKAL
jgi:hypothetical protein